MSKRKKRLTDWNEIENAIGEEAEKYFNNQSEKVVLN